MCLELRRAEVMLHRSAARASYSRFLAARLDRRRLMLRAWALVRTGAPGPARDLMGPALTRAWRERRERLATLG